MSKILSYAFGAMLLFNVSCRNDNNDAPAVPKGAYENGILVSNEGDFSKPNAEISFIDAGLSNITNGIYGANNNGAQLGNVLNSVTFNGDNAYLVVNNSNKIVVANRYTMKKQAEITQNLVTPRYATFANSKLYVTNNNFGFGTPATYKLTIYDSNNKFLKEINFDHFAEKVTAQSGYVYVQTDGEKYDANYNPLPTGHTITRINTNTDSVDKTITLTDNGIIKDMVSSNGVVYVLTSDGVNSNIYKIDAATGNFTQPIVAKGSDLSRISVDNGKIYFMDFADVYRLDATTVTKLFKTKSTNVYGFNVIDGKIYVSDAKNFTANSAVYVYDLSGTLLKEFTANVGVNGFYKN